MTESGAARPGDSQGRNLLHEKPRGDPCLADVTPVDREDHARWAGRAAARSQSKLRRGEEERVTLGSGVLESMRSNWMRWSIRRGTTRLTGVTLNSPHDKSADKRQSLETKPISRGTERSYGACGEDVATSSLQSNRMECRDAPAERLEQVPRRPGPK